MVAGVSGESRGTPFSSLFTWNLLTRYGPDVMLKIAEIEEAEKAEIEARRVVPGPPRSSGDEVQAESGLQEKAKLKGR